MLIFTSEGKLHWIKVHEIPQAGRRTKGRPIVNLLGLSSDEQMTAVVPVREFKEGKFVVMATEKGKIKKTPLTAFSNPRKGGILAVSLSGGDKLVGALLSDGDDEICLATSMGKAIRFKEKDIRAMGRSAQGVKGISIKKTDGVVGMVKVMPEATILTVTEKGFGKRTEFEEYRLQSRGGSGIINMKVVDKNGKVVGIKSVKETNEIMLISRNGMVVRVAVKGIRKSGRSTQGVRVISLNTKDSLTSIASVVAKEKEEKGISEEASLNSNGDIPPEDTGADDVNGALLEEDTEAAEE